MTKKLEQAIQRLKELADEEQDLAANAVLHFISDIPTADEWTAVSEGHAAYERGDFVTLAEWRHEMGLGDN
jgi:hypothetical protein